MFIYYHFANLKCEQKRRNTPQANLMAPIEAAFEPFAHFTPKATAAFVSGMHGRLQDLDAYTLKMSAELAEKRAEIKHSIDKLEKLTPMAYSPRANLRKSCGSRAPPWPK